MSGVRSTGGVTPGEPLLQVRGITRRFGRLTALDGVDLEVGAGEVLALFGPNGAGKTTLLRILASLMRPTSGGFTVAGDRAGAASVRCRIGMVSHESFLYPDLTAEENLRFAGRLFGVEPLQERVHSALAEVGLSDRTADPVRNLSRGMTQRVTLARALLHDPTVLLFDEPWSGLDPQAASILSGLLKREAARGRGVLVTTHNFAHGLDVATGVGILHRGRVVFRSAVRGLDAASIEKAYNEQVAAGGGA